MFERRSTVEDLERLPGRGADAVFDTGPNREAGAISPPPDKCSPSEIVLRLAQRSSARSREGRGNDGRDFHIPAAPTGGRDRRVEIDSHFRTAIKLSDNPKTKGDQSLSVALTLRLISGLENAGVPRPFESI